MHVFLLYSQTRDQLAHGRRRPHRIGRVEHGRDEDRLGKGGRRIHCMPSIVVDIGECSPMQVSGGIIRDAEGDGYGRDERVVINSRRVIR